MTSEHVFPQKISDSTVAAIAGGLTKRELFAAMAMQGFNANSHDSFEKWSALDTAQEAVQFADALLAELAKERAE